MSLRQVVAHPAVNYVTTRPGRRLLVAFVVELGISFILMSVVYGFPTLHSWGRYTPLFAGALLATYITLEAPISGMSMNLARTSVRQWPPNSGHRYGFISQRPRWGCSRRRRTTAGRRGPMGRSTTAATLRTYIKRLPRKTLCYSRSVLMQDVMIGLFIHMV